MENQNDIPGEWAWLNSYEMGLDAAYSYKMFYGKTFDEALDYFRNSVLGASECLYYMPDIPFQYYVLTFTHYLMDENLMTLYYDEAPSGASAFLNLVLTKLEKAPQSIMPVMEKLMPVAEFVALHQEKYDADLDIFGSFPEKLHEIKSHYTRALENIEITDTY